MELFAVEHEKPPVRLTARGSDLDLQGRAREKFENRAAMRTLVFAVGSTHEFASRAEERGEGTRNASRV
jgi:hypothetical protein